MKNSLSTLLLTIIVLLLLNACATPSQIWNDAKVRKLCKKDGGIKVYETVKLPAERFETDGSIYIPAKSLAKPEDEYFYDTLTTHIKRGNPELIQLRNWVHRKYDNNMTTNC